MTLIAPPRGTRRAEIRPISILSLSLLRLLDSNSPYKYVG